jgi:hypothetical protein
MIKQYISNISKFRKNSDSYSLKQLLNILKDIKTLLSTTYKQEEKEIYITNLHRKMRLKEKKYCLILEEDKIEMITKTLFNKTVRCLNLKTLDYNVNYEPASLDNLEVLFNSVQVALRGLEEGLATAYVSS